LQLQGGESSARASIRQTARVLPGRTYVATVEFRGEAPPAGATIPDEPSFTGSLDGLAWFRQPLAGARPSDGWWRREARFRPNGPDLEIRLELRGGAGSREETTVAVDTVTLVEDDSVPVVPFRAKYRLVEEKQRPSVALGWNVEGSASGTGYDLLERLRATTGQGAAWLPWNLAWDLVRNPVFPMEAFRAEAEPWARSGTVPVLTLRGAAPLELPPDEIEDSFRGLARALRDWGFPVVLRPWPEMERHHKSGSAGDFVGLWRRARGWFSAEGAGHVAWWWTPDQFSPEAAGFYPGDGHVDWVGCTDRDGDLDTIYGAYALRYRRKPLAIPESPPLGSVPSLAGFSRRFAERYPRLEFYGVTMDERHLGDPEWTRQFREAGWDRGSPEAGFRLPQRTPPRAVAVVRATDRGWEAVITNPGDDTAAPVSEFLCRFHEGNPAEGGRPVGRLRSIRLRRGEEKILREPLPASPDAVPWMRITARPGAEALGGPGAPPDEIRDFRGKAGDGS
jgi:hypothetical protein